MIIFVTVGTSSSGYDDLIKAVDSIAPSLLSQVIMQIGNGKYKPAHGEYFRFTSSLFPYFEKADLVISSGGVGTLFELLSRNKKTIGVSNIHMPNRHQDEILKKLSNEGYLLWCKELQQLKEFIDRAETVTLKPYQNEPCQIHNAILNFLQDKIPS